jgi:hypothetical protein
MIRRAIKLVLYAAALGGGAVLGAVVSGPIVAGSGVPATEERSIGDVSEVTVSGDGMVTIVRGSLPSVTVTADDNLLQYVKTETDGRTLRLSGGTGFSVRAKTKPEYKVTLPHLEALTVSGAGHATVERPVGDELKVKLSGAGTITLREVTYQSLNVTASGAGKITATGAATRAQFKLSGAGGIDAGGLRTSFTDVQVSGAGQATVWSTLELKARVSGAGGVRYKGSPTVEQKVSGAGRVRPLE